MKIGVCTSPWSVWNRAARAFEPVASFSSVKLSRDMRVGRSEPASKEARGGAGERKLTKEKMPHAGGAKFAEEGLIFALLASFA